MAYQHQWNTRLKLLLCLKAFVKSVKNLASYQNAFQSYNDFFIVDDRQEVINFIDDANFHRKRGGSKNIHTYDFSNMYTSIPHQKLKCNVRKFVEDIFQGAGKLFVNIKNKVFLVMIQHLVLDN